MKSIKSVHLFTLCAFIILLSCKKDIKVKIDEPKPKIEEPLPTTDEPVPKEPIPGPEEPIIPIPVEKGIYIPIKLEASDITVNLYYRDNSTLLREITESNGNKSIITYNAIGYPQKIEKSKNGNPISIDYYYQNDKKLTHKVLAYNYGTKNATIPNGEFTLTYNEQLKFSSVNYYNTTKNLIKTNNLRYDESLNVIEINTNTPTNTTSYTFDQKRGITSNITFNDLFSLQFEHWFLRCIHNNVLTKQDQGINENYDISYEYNENGYPSNATLTYAKNKQAIKITYKRLEQ